MNTETRNDHDVVRARMSAAQFDGGEAPARFMWMPAGVHTVSATHDSGKDIILTVEVEPTAIDRVRAFFKKIIDANSRRRPYGDFDHSRNQASIWPDDFEWESGSEPGIYVRGEWSEAGLKSVKGKMYRGWSPTFGSDADFDRAIENDGVLEFPEGVRGSATNPARITKVGFDIGTLTNEPAFRKISPVRAKDAAPAIADRTKTGGKPPEGAAMDPNTTAVPTAELELIRAKAAKADELEKTSTLTQEEAKKDRQALADRILDAAFVRATERSAMAPKDENITARARKIARADLDAGIEYLDGLPVNADLVKAKESASGKRQTASIEVKQHSIYDLLTGFVRAKQPINGLMQAGRTVEAVECSQSAGLIYANEIKPVFDKVDFRMRDLVRAATTTEAAGNVGSLAGDLVLQRVVEYLKNFLPLISRVTSDFRNEPIMFGQTAIARYVGDPTVLTYNTSTGWGSDAAKGSGSIPSATDIPVVINTYKGIEIRFNQQDIAGTVRNLFQEQVDPSTYKLAATVNDALLALITAANYTNTAVTIALADFKLASFAALRKAADDAKISREPGNRTILLHSDYGNKLLEDGNWILSSAFRSAIAYKEDVIASGVMPEIFGMLPIDTQTMPTTANLVGAVFGRSAMALAARIPSDYTTVFPDLPPTASVTVATEPMTGLTMMMVRYLNHQMELANARISLMYGVAKGQPGALTRIVKA
jgi:hypothetical protein